MTDLIAKNADFSGGRVIGYTPPVDGLEFFGWMGASVADSLRNFGIGSDAEAVGNISSIGDYFAELNIDGFIDTGITLNQNERTFFTVCKQVVPGAGSNQKAIFISTENNSPIGTRQGMSLYSSTASRFSTIRFRGGDSSASAGPSVAAVGEDTTRWNALVSTVFLQSDGNLRIRMQNLTTGELINSYVLANDIYTYQEPAIRIGATSRDDGGAFTGKARIACAAIAKRSLSDAEIDALYQSAKRRMANFGISI